MDDLIDFENRDEPLASRAVFVRRVRRNIGVALLVLAVSLAIGTTGYMTFEDMSFIDGLLNASMILSTMGPLNVPKTDAGKLFASVYAIASGLLLFTVAGLVLAPVYHRMIHRFHLEVEDDEEKDDRKRDVPS